MKSRLLLLLAVVLSVCHVRADVPAHALAEESAPVAGCDLAIVEHLGPVDIYMSPEIPIGLVVENHGDEVIDHFTATYTTSFQPPVTQTFTGLHLTAEDGPYYFWFDQPIPMLNKMGSEVYISVSADGDVNADNDLYRYVIRNNDYAVLAFYDLGFELAHDELIIQDENPEVEGNTTWKFAPAWGDSWCVEHVSGSDRTVPADDWFFVPPLWAEPGSYLLSFEYETSGSDEQLEIWRGTERSKAGMNRQLMTVTQPSVATTTERKLVFDVDKYGPMTLGFHLTSPRSERFTIYRIKLERYERSSVDIGITSAKVDYADYLCKDFPESARVNVGMKNVSNFQDVYGIPLEIKSGRKVVYTDTLESLGGDVGAICGFTLPLDGMTPGEQNLTFSISHQQDDNPENNTVEVPVRVIGGPTALAYDFEDGLMPEGCQTFCLDKGVMVDNPENPAWYIDTYERRGESPTMRIFSSSYFTKKVKSDRWLVLPQVAVAGDSPVLVWRDGGIDCADAPFHERPVYEVLVSENGTDPSDFTKVADFYFLPRTSWHYVDLKSYSGKNIYVAFRLVTDTGYKLSLDDIHLYRMGGNDLALVDNFGPRTGYQLEQAEAGVVVENRGTGIIDHFTVRCQVDGQEVCEQTFSGLHLSAADGPTRFMLSERLALQGGEHKVTLTVETDDDTDAGNNSFAYTYVSKEREETPFHIDFECGHEDIRFVDSNPDSRNNDTWQYLQDAEGNWRLGCVAPQTDDERGTDPNDWFFLPPVFVNEGIYMLTYDVESPNFEEWQIMYGSDRTPEAMTENITFQVRETPNGSERDTVIVKIDEAQTLCIGFRIGGVNHRALYVDNINLVPHTPGAPDAALRNLRQRATDCVLLNDSTTYGMEYDIVNTTIDSPLYDIEHHSGFEGYEVWSSDPLSCIDPQRATNVGLRLQMEGMMPGDYTYVAWVDQKDDINAANDTLRIPVSVIGGKPLFKFDFEDGRFPEECAYCQLDDGTMIGNWDDPSWYFGKMEDPLRGNSNAIISSSNLIGSTWADRWLILPQIAVPEDGADLVWRVGCILNFDYYDRSLLYEVHISETGNTPWDFFKVETRQAPYAPAFQHLNLDAYKGKNIYVAFRLFSDSGHELALDDIACYTRGQGDLELVDNFGTRNGYGLDEADFGVVVKRRGPGETHSFKVQATVNGEEVCEHTFDGLHLTEADGPVCFRLPETAPLNGLGTYKVKLTVSTDEDAIENNNTVTYDLVNREYAPTPLQIDFECAHDQIVIEDSNPDTPHNLSWTYSMDKTGNWSLGCISPDGNYPMADDWFFLPPMEVTPGLYKLSYDVDSPEDYENCEIWSGMGRAASEMTEYVRDISSYTPDGPEHRSFVIEITQPQIYYLGFHLSSFSNRSIRLDNICFEPHTPGPAEVQLNAVTVTCDGFLPLFDPSSCIAYIDLVNPTIDRPLQDIAIELMLNGEPVASDVLSSLGQEEGCQMQIPLPVENFAPGDYILSARISHPDDTNPDNNYQEIPVRLIGGDTLFKYDFNNGQLPKGSQTLFVEDGVIVDHPETPAWYAETIDHPYEGWTTVLVTSEELEDHTTAESWVILPVVRLDSDRSDLIWSSCSLMTDHADPEVYPEYELFISETGTEPDDFTLAGTFTAADGFNLERFKLDDYDGKTIYIAFRDHSSPGYRICLDDITLYSEIREGSTGIEQATDASALRLVGNQLLCGSSVDLLEVIDLNGRVVASAAHTDHLSVAHLQAGVYVARMHAAGRVVNVKFVR